MDNGPSNNYFNVDEPENYICKVWRYRVSHSEMYVRAQPSAQRSGGIITPDDMFFLVFLDVRYFDGPMRWQGANFTVDTSEECAKLWMKLEPELTLREGYLYNLFTVKFLEGNIRILAAKGFVENTPPFYDILSRQ